MVSEGSYTKDPTAIDSPNKFQSAVGTLDTKDRIIIERLGDKSSQKSALVHTENGSGGERDELQATLPLAPGLVSSVRPPTILTLHLESRSRLPARRWGEEERERERDREIRFKQLCLSHVSSYALLGPSTSSRHKLRARD